jgi:hypothetical protein
VPGVLRLRVRLRTAPFVISKSIKRKLSDARLPGHCTGNHCLCWSLIRRLMRNYWWEVGLPSRRRQWQHRCINTHISLVARLRQLKSGLFAVRQSRQAHFCIPFDDVFTFGFEVTRAWTSFAQELLHVIPLLHSHCEDFTVQLWERIEGEIHVQRRGVILVTFLFYWR